MANDLQNMNSQTPSGISTISQVTSSMNGYGGNLGPVQDTLSGFYSLVNPYRDLLEQYMYGENTGLLGQLMNNKMNKNA